MNRRFIGNNLLLSFLFLSLSGFLLYVLPFSKEAASLHTTVAFIFCIILYIHIYNNRVPILNYLSGKRQKGFLRFQSIAILIMFILITLSVYHNHSFTNWIYNWGNEFRNQQLGKKESSFNYEHINVSQDMHGTELTIEVKKGKSFQYPLFAIWAEDTLGNYLETLYVSRVISSSKFDYGKKVDDVWTADIIRRPESLPYWAHKRGIKEKDGYYLPLEHTSDLDGVSGATPTDNFIITTKQKTYTKSFNIFLEVNQSYDWNNYFTKTKFPNDSIYSGSGQVGQPSLIYGANIRTSEQEKHFLMNLKGHGHHSGKSGVLNKNLSTITTAKEILDRIIIQLK